MPFVVPGAALARDNHPNGVTRPKLAQDSTVQYSGVVAPPARDHIASQALPAATLAVTRAMEPKPTTGMAALGWMQRGPSPASLRQR